jgi:hypothetical protein
MRQRALQLSLETPAQTLWETSPFNQHRSLRRLCYSALDWLCLRLEYVDLRPISQRHDTDCRPINGFVTFSTVDVFLVTVTPAVDFGGHEMFIDFFLTRRIYGAKITTPVRVLVRMGTVPIWRKSVKIQRNLPLYFNGGVEL